MELTLMTLAIRRDREPDWQAADEAIECLDLATIWDTGDDLFPWEGWLEDAPNPPAAFGVYTAIREAQEDLRRAASYVRPAIDQPGSHDLDLLELPDHRVYVTGGVSSGESVGELFDDLLFFTEGGIARAAGFESWTQFAGRRLDQRRLEFAGDDLRRVRATRAFAYAEDAADRLIGEYTNGTPEDWTKRWMRPLHEALNGDDDRRYAGRALMRFTAETMALIFALEQMTPKGERRPRDVVVREAVELIDEVERTRRKSHRRASKLLERACMPFEGLLPALVGRGDGEAAEELIRFSGAPLSEAICTELQVQVLMDELFAVADLFGKELCEIRPLESGKTIEPVRRRPDRGLRRAKGRQRARTPATQIPPKQRRQSMGNRGDIAWCAAKSFDWSAAGSAIDANDEATARELRGYLNEFRDIVEGSYRRLVTWQDVGDLRIWLTAGEWRDGWTLVTPLRELGDAGVLEAAGAVGWG